MRICYGNIELDVNGIISTGSVMFIIAALYLFFDTRMPFIKLENFNHLIHNLRGKFLLFYFFLFDVIMVASIPFIRTLLFFDAITGKKLFYFLVLMSLLYSLILVSSFLIVLFMCRLDCSAYNINVITEASNKDPLTGILNRAGFIYRMEKSLQEGNQGAFFLIDLDNFKAVNDNLGHQTGDEVLVECANVMRQVFRSTDYIGRLGGDEFMAFAQNLTDTNIIIHRDNSLCEKLSFSVGDGNPSVKIGCSIGIVTDTEKSDFSKIYQEADKTLYSAKSKGKGRYCFS